MYLYIKILIKIFLEKKKKQYIKIFPYIKNFCIIFFSIGKYLYINVFVFKLFIYFLNIIFIYKNVYK
jgi:hypothetical protein